MASPPGVGDLEIGQDLEFQERLWKVQRIGWVIMPVLVVIALSGMLGGGLVNQETVGEQNGSLYVEYPRFARLRSPTDLRVQRGSGRAQGNEIRVWLTTACWKAFKLSRSLWKHRNLLIKHVGLFYA